MPTKIPWTDETWNPVSGCSPISAGCKNCYANRMSKRLAGRFGYPPAPRNFDVTFHPDKLDQPLHWKKPRRIFPCSMGDLFHEDVPDEWIDRVFDVIQSAWWHTFQILTKRPERALEWCCQSGRMPLPNVWLGVTAENQEQANKRILILLQIPAAVRFVSVEPMLSEVNLTNQPWWDHRPEYDYWKAVYPWARKTLDWVIVGAETGPGKRPMNLDWARSVRDQCVRAGIPFFFKKDSEGWQTLDSCIWDQFPEE